MSGPVDGAQAQRALGELLTADLSAAEKNTAIPGAQQAITHHAHNIATLVTARNKIPTQLPVNQIDPTAKRALQRCNVPNPSQVVTWGFVDSRCS